ncbi:hypothetical protein NQZ79_g6088 [Umbelopsis isabellina]|nr:hypothetical protein NQZ79_g6088 [Umbelopsis isabellina]
MAMHNANAFWAAQECSTGSNNAKLFLHPDTPTGTTTYVMANKRKDTLYNRHKRQLRRLIDMQIEEHQDLRRKISEQCPDEARKEYFASQPSSPIGLFELVPGNEWLKKNYENIFKPASWPPKDNNKEPSKSSTSELQLGKYKLLMGVSEQEQNTMRIRHSQEYEHYRLLQLKEVQMLSPNLVTNPPNIPLPKPVPSPPPTIAIPPSEIAPPYQPESQTTMQTPIVHVSLAKSIQFKRSRSDDVVTSPTSHQIPVDHSSSIPTTRVPGTKQFNSKRESRSRRVPPPPPPPPTRHLSSPAPSPIELIHNQDRVRGDQNEHSNKEEQNRPAPLKRSRSPSPMSREGIERARSSSRWREGRSRSPNIDGSRYQRLPVKRPKSCRKPHAPQHSRKRPYSESTSQQNLGPVRYTAPSKPRKPSIANPDAVSHHTTQAVSGNAPPMVTSSRNKPNDDKYRPHGDKHKRDSVPSALTVENVPGQGMNVVRRYTGGKKPMEILGDPRDFDDALHKPTPKTPIIQNRTSWQGLCFLQRNTRKVLASVAEVEPVIRNHFTSGSSNNMDL